MGSLKALFDACDHNGDHELDLSEFMEFVKLEIQSIIGHYTMEKINLTSLEEKCVHTLERREEFFIKELNKLAFDYIEKVNQIEKKKGEEKEERLNMAYKRYIEQKNP